MEKPFNVHFGFHARAALVAFATPACYRKRPWAAWYSALKGRWILTYRGELWEV